jgi:hypothetical protein
VRQVVTFAHPLVETEDKLEASVRHSLRSQNTILCRSGGEPLGNVQTPGDKLEACPTLELGFQLVFRLGEAI